MVAMKQIANNGRCSKKDALVEQPSCNIRSIIYSLKKQDKRKHSVQVVTLQLDANRRTYLNQFNLSILYRPRLNVESGPTIGGLTVFQRAPNGQNKNSDGLSPGGKHLGKCNVLPTNCSNAQRALNGTSTSLSIIHSFSIGPT